MKRETRETLLGLTVMIGIAAPFAALALVPTGLPSDKELQAEGFRVAHGKPRVQLWKITPLVDNKRGFISNTVPAHLGIVLDSPTAYFVNYDTGLYVAIEGGFIAEEFYKEQP